MSVTIVALACEGGAGTTSFCEACYFVCLLFKRVVVSAFVGTGLIFEQSNRVGFAIFVRNVEHQIRWGTRLVCFCESPDLHRARRRLSTLPGNALVLVPTLRDSIPQSQTEHLFRSQ